MYVCTCHSACGSQRITFKSWFFPSTVWVLGIELRSPGLVAGASPSEPSCQACMTVFKTIFSLHHCFHALLIVYILNCVWAWPDSVLFRSPSFCSSCLALPTLAGFLAAASSLKVSSSELNRVVSELRSSQGYWGCRVLILATELFVFLPNCPWNLCEWAGAFSPAPRKEGAAFYPWLCSPPCAEPSHYCEASVSNSRALGLPVHPSGLFWHVNTL